jgi:hypothetical protein
MQKCTTKHININMSFSNRPNLVSKAKNETRITHMSHSIVKASPQVLTPKFGKEYNLWVQLGEESVWWKERIFSDVFGKEVCGRLSAPVRQGNS